MKRLQRPGQVENGRIGNGRAPFRLVQPMEAFALVHAQKTGTDEAYLYKKLRQKREKDRLKVAKKRKLQGAPEENSTVANCELIGSVHSPQRSLEEEDQVLKSRESKFAQEQTVQVAFETRSMDDGKELNPDSTYRAVVAGPKQASQGCRKEGNPASQVPEPFHIVKHGWEECSSTPTQQKTSRRRKAVAVLVQTARSQSKEAEAVRAEARPPSEQQEEGQRAGCSMASLQKAEAETELESVSAQSQAGKDPCIEEECAASEPDGRSQCSEAASIMLSLRESIRLQTPARDTVTTEMTRTMEGGNLPPSPVALGPARGGSDPWDNYRRLRQQGCLVLRIPYQEFGWRGACFEEEGVQAFGRLTPDASSAHRAFEGFKPLSEETMHASELRQEQAIPRETHAAHYQRLQQLFDLYFGGTPLQALTVASSCSLVSFPGAPSQFRHLKARPRECSQHAVSFVIPCTHPAHMHVWPGSTTMLEAVADTQDPTSDAVAYDDDVSDGELTQRAMKAAGRAASTILRMETVVAHPHSVVVFFSHLVHACAAWSSIWHHPNVQVHAHFSVDAVPPRAMPLPRWLHCATDDALHETERLEAWLGERGACSESADAGREADKRQQT